MESELAVSQGTPVPELVQPTMMTPKEIVAHAADAASALVDVIKSKPKSKGLVKQDGSRFTEYDEYQLIAKFMGEGFTTRTVRTERVELPDGSEGWKCYAEGTDAAGIVRASADALCCTDEPSWKNKPDFQRLSMAQTRAHAKCHRQKYSYVAILAGFSATPQEEMDGATPQVRTQSAQSAPPSGVQVFFCAWNEGSIPKHTPLSDPGVRLADLESYGKWLAEKLDDPKNQKYRKKNEAHIAEVRAEYKRRTEDQSAPEPPRDRPATEPIDAEYEDIPVGNLQA